MIAKSMLPFRDTVLGAKIAVDELACIARRAFTRHLLEDQWRRIISEVEQAEGFFLRQGWLDEPTLYHGASARMSDIRATRAQCLGVDFQHLRFASNYEPLSGEPGRERWIGYAPNRTAHAWVVRHGGRPRPWLICIPGYSMGTPYLDMTAFSVAWLHQRLGLNVLVPVLPFHGPRRVHWASGEGFFAGDCLDTVHAEAQAILELRQLVVWLRELGAPSIGVYGLSLGGYTAALLAAFEPDLACVIAGIPASDFARLARLHTPPRMLEMAAALGFDWVKVERVLRVISPLATKPLIPKARRYIFGGLGDRIVPRSQVRDLWKHWERPKAMWYRGSHLSFCWEPRVQGWLRPILRGSLCDEIVRPAAVADELAPQVA